MEAKKASYPIALMARVLGVSRQGYYQWRARRQARRRRALAQAEFDRVVACAFEDYHRTHGAPRLVVALAKMGVVADKKTITASLKRQGLEAVSTRSYYRHPSTSGECDYDDHCQRQWDKGDLDRVWISDFTYLRCAEGWVYLVVVRDGHSRRVLGYAMGAKQTTNLLTEALDMALATRGGAMPAQVVLHADRGTQFTSGQLARYAAQAGIVMSMGKTGVCWDNAMAESFWATLKVEYYYRHTFRIREEVYEGVAHWIEGFYNHKRIHSAIGYQSPVEYELHAHMDIAA
ncbi:IS3 family transposase [Trueperella pyogenes]|uniref:IS3 family transposase n=1 Tax=Trueperella pyogenes TaxID=1661 RepID=UPI0032442F1F